MFLDYLLIFELSFENLVIDSGFDHGCLLTPKSFLSDWASLPSHPVEFTLASEAVLRGQAGHTLLEVGTSGSGDRLDGFFTGKGWRVLTGTSYGDRLAIPCSPAGGLPRSSHPHAG